MKDFFRILRLGRPYVRYAVLNGVLNLVSTVFHLASMLLFIPFLRLLMGKVNPQHIRPALSWNKETLEQTFNWWLTELIEQRGQVGALAIICSAVVILFLLKNLFRYLATIAISRFRLGIVRDLRAQVFSKMLELPMRYHTEERKGNQLSILTNDMQVLEFSAMQSIEMVMREPLAVLLFLGTMVTLSPELTLYSLLLLPISGLLIARITRTLKRRSTRVQERSAQLLALSEEALTGMRVIKAFNAEQAMHRRFQRENEMLMRSSISMVNRQDIASPLSETLGTVVMAVIAFLGGTLVLGPEPSLTGDSFLGFIIIFSQLLTPIKGFSKGYSAIVRGGSSAKRVFELLAVPNTVMDKPGALPKAAFTDRVEFQGVSFAYDESSPPVLQDINLTLAKGQSVALVGGSGGGKTTLAGLLPRFFDVTGGSVCIDGTDIRDLRIRDLRGLLGIVTQDSLLFNDTVASNIAFGRTGISEEDIHNAAKVANAHDFIMQLPEGYQTRIGDAGNRLSGGQKQRISIARAVLGDPDILILDEATSALDTESERLVQEALLQLMKDRTSLVIAHRLSTIQRSDEICVLDRGRIIERGTHAELYAANGQYRKLCDLQAFA